MVSHQGRRRVAAQVAASATHTADLTKPRKRTAPAATIDLTHNHDLDWRSLLLTQQTHVKNVLNLHSGRLFTTDAEGLWGSYMRCLPGEHQVHDCRACRRFVESFGGLVAIDEGGGTVPVVWPVIGVPDFYAVSVARIRQLVSEAKVTGVFLSPDSVLGFPETDGGWTHMSAHLPHAMRYREAGRTAHQAVAAKLEDHGTVLRAIGEFRVEQIDEALQVLDADSINRSEKFIEPLKWLRSRRSEWVRTRNHTLRDNLLWVAVADALEGFCHPRTSVVGSLLEDVAAGLGFEAIRRRFNAKMHPLRYQRPQAAPKAGNVAASERLVQTLGIERSLARRYATLADALPHAVWLPNAVRNKAKKAALATGVFAHLKPMDPIAQPTVPGMPAQTMTWDKFRRTVLPEAQRVEFRTPHGNAAYMSLTTAAHTDAPPIIRWDSDEARNPVSWFVYVGGTRPEAIGLSAGAWIPVAAVVPLPNMWGGERRQQPHHGDGAVLVLSGAKALPCSSNVLFPEHLRGELHGARATIEAYSKSATLSGFADGLTGYDLRKGGSYDCLLRVEKGGRWTEYRIDRWD